MTDSHSFPPATSARQKRADCLANFPLLGRRAGLLRPRPLQHAVLVRRFRLCIIAVGIEHAQADGYCPGIDPKLTASALSSMIEHFCYVWLAQGGDAIDAELDEQRAIDSLVSIWFHAIYWRPERGSTTDS